MHFRGSLHMDTPSEDTWSKICVYGVVNNLYLQETYKLGQKIIDFVPIAYRTLNNPHMSSKFDRSVTRDLMAWRPPPSWKKKFKESGIKTRPSVQHVIGFNFIQNPLSCLDNLFGSLGSDTAYNPDMTGFLGDILQELESLDGSQVALNPEYLFHQGTEFTLPPLGDASPVVTTLLVNSSVVGPRAREPLSTSMALEHYLTLVSRFGSSLYDILVRRSILVHSRGDHFSTLYYMLVSSEYVQFLVETSRVFNKLIESKQMVDSIIKNSARDLYHRQLGQYFAVLAFTKPQDTVDWCSTHVKNYIDIFDNLTDMEIKQFTKDFSTTLRFSSTSIDRVELESMRSYLKRIQVPEPPSQDQEECRAIAVDCVSVASYKATIVNSFEILTKRRTLVLQALEEYPGILSSLGRLVQINESEGIRQVTTMVSGMLQRPSEELDLTRTLGNFRFEDFGLLESEIPGASHLANLLAVNYHISRHYLKETECSPRERSKYCSIMQKYSQLGYSFYRYNVLLWLADSQLPIKTQIHLQQKLLSKTFKTLVYNNIKTPTDPVYMEMVKARASNRYIKLKLGQTGFDQYMGLLAITNQEEYVKKWINNCVAAIKQAPSATEFPQLLPQKPYDFVQTDTNPELDLEESFDFVLTGYYDSLE
ncbi:hypothetical protein PSN45_002695 [Yamadazyma tenuis]|nr:hypothetical protein PSN45_002695 [Yamadazyma tenuis]